MTSTHKTSPSEQTLESLSALVDGEASEFEGRRLLGMVGDPELSEKWQRYNLAGALMRKELSSPSLSDLSDRISAAIYDEAEHALGEPPVAAVTTNTVVRASRWRDWMAKSAIAASVAVAAVAGVQFSQNGSLAGLDGNAPLVASQDPVITAPVGFDLPSPVARNVSLGSLAEPQRKIQAAAPAKQQFLSNAQVDAELQQLFLEHAELSAENGKFGLMPMARAAKMAPTE